MKTLLLSGLLLCVSCSRQDEVAPVSALRPVASFNGSLALEEVRRFLTVGDRVAGTPGAQHAADFIVQRLDSTGIAVEQQAFREAVPGGSNTFVNVIATLPGKKPGWVILGAHYDTKSGIEPFAGANDSGSGVGVLLALAPILKGSAADRPGVQLAFFDGEECRVSYGPDDGLHGSRYLAARLSESGRAREVRAFILLDMIGDRDLTVTIPRNGTPELISRVFAAATECGLRSKFALFRGSILDDHQPFLDHGMPAVDLIDFEYGSAPGRNDYWHTPSDTLDKLSAESLGTMGRVVLQVLSGL